MKQIDPAGTASPAAPLRLCFLSYRHLSELALTVMPDFAGRARIEVIEASFDSALPPRWRAKRRARWTCS